MTGVDLLGYAASALVAVSLVMTSVLRLRLLNLAGSIAFLIYGVLLNSVPVIITNVIVIGINLYFLAQMLTAKHYFKLLEVDKHSSYVRSFVDFHTKDIGRYFPHFRYDPARVEFVYLILRDMMPVGLFVTERDSAGRALVQLDYVIPGYRDLQPGKFLYNELDGLLPAKGIRELYSVPGSEYHHDYLERMGFTPTLEATSGKLFQRTMAVQQNPST